MNSARHDRAETNASESVLSFLAVAGLQLCPDCAGPVRIIAFLTEAASVNALLTHLAYIPHISGRI